MQLKEANLADDERLLYSVEAIFRTFSKPQPDRPLKIGLAVSGGSDSMAMLLAFTQAKAVHDIEIFVATVDHGLRDGAKAEAEFVARTCQFLGVSHQILTWEGWKGTGNLQAEARDARYHLLANWAKGQELATVTIGHTSNDQAETFLARLARGSGLDGLSGMEPNFQRHDVTFTRPFLHLEREMLRRFLRRNGHKWCDDPSNEDVRFQRVNVRKALEILDPLGIDSHQISQAASQLSQAKHALRSIAAKAAEDMVHIEGGDLVISGNRFANASPEIGRRILGAALQWIGQSDYPPRAEAIDEMLRAIRQHKTRTLNGCLITARKHDVRIAREFQTVKDTVCNTGQVWDGRWLLDGPNRADYQVRALGEAGLMHCPSWREVDLPRTSLISSPAVWRGEELIAAPLAKLNPEWTATLQRGEKQFFSFMVPH